MITRIGIVIRQIGEQAGTWVTLQLEDMGDSSPSEMGDTSAFDVTSLEPSTWWVDESARARDGRAVGSRCRSRRTVRKPAGQAHMTALVGEIGADTATIARHWATIQTRIRFPHRGRRGRL